MLKKEESLTDPVKEVTFDAVEVNVCAAELFVRLIIADALTIPVTVPLNVETSPLNPDTSPLNPDTSPLKVETLPLKVETSPLKPDTSLEIVPIC